MNFGQVCSVYGSLQVALFEQPSHPCTHTTNLPWNNLESCQALLAHPRIQQHLYTALQLVLGHWTVQQGLRVYPLFFYCLYQNRKNANKYTMRFIRLSVADIKEEHERVFVAHSRIGSLIAKSYFPPSIFLISIFAAFAAMRRFCWFFLCFSSFSIIIFTRRLDVWER